MHFNDTSFVSTPQVTGGFVDYYSNWGPHWFDYNLKPQIGAPGGNILSTWPLGAQGSYAILSGTSMATPFVSASYALVKSALPELSVDDIIALLQTNAKPLQWVWDKSMLATTVQQGAGMINVYDAIMSKTRVSPGQIAITDVSKKEWGIANVTVENKSGSPRKYIFEHQPAPYTSKDLDYREKNQQPIYGSIDLPETIDLDPGESRTFNVRFHPPASGIVPKKDPIIGGFIKVTSDNNEQQHIPYAGAPFSLFNTNYITFSADRANPFPRIYKEGEVVTTESVVFNSSTKFSSTIARDQYTTNYRVDVVPGRSTLKPNHYGYDPTKRPCFNASSVAPQSSFLGYLTYGNLLNLTGIVSPGTNIWPSGNGLAVKTDGGATVKLQPGGYRWLVSVLRWGGDPTLLEDWDTWLSPLIKVIDGPA